jgi:4-amino-4-deoxy-L-arabinose transferase-like glycosyltransferase
LRTENFFMPKVPFWIFILLAILHLSAFYIDVMDVDASQYAEMSREMMESGSYLQVYDRGGEYLDKPPFLFWISSLSMKVFGVNNFAYKLPSVLFAFWAWYATYRLARLLYGEAAGRIAALVLGACQGMFLMTNDIRTDTILMSWVVTAIWLIKEWDLTGKLKYFLFGCGAIAFGMMTKGPIALLVPAFCFVSDWFLKREWRKFFRPVYLLGILVIAILLVPMSIGLYQQFDMHPEKPVNGVQGVSGLRFFYWSQSFGRITGESPWNNGAGFDFLFSSMLWAFLPWILFFVAALFINIIQLVKQRFLLRPDQEWITTGGFILSYIALGSSKYQLPHYIFVVFPLAAIMVAALIKAYFENHSFQGLFRILRPTQIVISALLLAAALLVISTVFPSGVVGYLLWVVALVIWLFTFRKSARVSRFFYMSVAGIMLANVFLTHYFYRNLLQFQAGSQMGRFISKNKIDPTQVKFRALENAVVALHFYAGHIIRDTGTFRSGKYVFTGTAGLDSFNAEGYSYYIVNQGVYFRVSEVTPDFLNYKTRGKAVKPHYLIRLK